MIRNLEKELSIWKKNVFIKDDIDDRGIRTGILCYVLKKDYIKVGGFFAAICLDNDFSGGNGLNE